MESAEIVPVAGGFHAVRHTTGRTITTFGRTPDEAEAALTEACERAQRLAKRVDRGEHLKPRDDG